MTLYVTLMGTIFNLKIFLGRTRRSTRAATKRQYTYDEEEILETRTKLRKVIDSDSDFD